MTTRIYLDHAATTPVLPAARAAMADALARWANPSSPHADGRAARALLEEARAAIAAALGWPHDIILTSGASEAITIAAARAKVAGRIIGATEHDVVPFAMGSGATVLPVNQGGIIDLDALEAALAQGPALLAIQLVNNETGVIQPAEAILKRVRAAGSLWLADCAQAAGKIELPDADFIAVSAHKLGGPPGVGVLLVRDIAVLEPSGGQERGYRRGTQDVPGAAAFAAALESGAFREAMPRLALLRERLSDGMRHAGAIVIAANTPRIATIGAVALPGLASASLLVQLDLAGFSVSAGSACSSGSLKPSHVLAAMGIAPDLTTSTIRISFGPHTSDAEVDAFLAAFRAIAERRRAA
ncbi:aminotransferase class V-fold PLP-dependent enzyme [Sphingomonas sp.]|uniref:cysteine desulfurase family protein n=1 Tax=Sphingomonas sp. TaxID=28214 RepID=UPI00286BA2C3|nr:aminotransferase class V-fold PLP-dependent enzyme [Sphingomonas sp.]